MPTNRIIPAAGHYIIRDSRTGKVSYWQKEYHQSAADAHGVSTADYIHAMYFFLMQAGARNVLMIGCGGGTLATMLVRSNVQVTVVDLHKFSFDIARKYFHLPDAVTCHVADGVEYLKTHRQRHDALVLDAFVERIQEILTGDNKMNCQLCKYREQVIGYEAEVATPQAGHHPHVRGIGTDADHHHHDHDHDHDGHNHPHDSDGSHRH